MLAVDFQEKLKGRRPGWRPCPPDPATPIAAEPVWEGRDLYVKVDSSTPGTGFGKILPGDETHPGR